MKKEEGVEVKGVKRPPREPRKIEFKVQSFREGKEGREREGERKGKRGISEQSPEPLGKKGRKR